MAEPDSRSTQHTAVRGKRIYGSSEKRLRDCRAEVSKLAERRSDWGTSHDAKQEKTRTGTLLKRLRKSLFQRSKQPYITPPQDFHRNDSL